MVSENERIYPTRDFEEFYQQFDRVVDIIHTKEWKEVYSHFYSFGDMELDIPIGETTDDQERFSPQKRLEEIYKCSQSFAYFCHRYIKILNVKYGTIPFLMYKYQHRTFENFLKRKFNIVSKFRQGGLTTIAVQMGLWECLFDTDKQIYVLSKTDREAVAAGSIADRALDNMPSWLIDAKNASFSKHEKVFGGTGSKICFYTPKAARGKTASMIIIDEAAFIPDMQNEWKAMYPVVATGGAVNVISTVNGLGNWYEEMYHEAEAGDNFFNVINLDYWEHPLYANPLWAKTARANMGERSWQQEIERSFHGSGPTYVPTHIVGELDKICRNTDAIRMAFPKYVNLNGENRVKFDWGSGALWIWKEPIEGHEYIIGVDAAEGLEADNSCFEVLDSDTLEQVAEFYSNRVPPHTFTQILNQIGLYYNTAKIVVENMSIGGAVLNGLQHDLFYENLFYEDRNVKGDKPGIKTGSHNREILLESLQQRLVTGSLRINSRRLVYELKTFKYNAKRKRAEADYGKHDDAVMAMCLALYARGTQVRGMPPGSDTPDSLKKMFNSEAYQEIKREIMEGSLEDWLRDRDKDQQEYNVFAVGSPDTDEGMQIGIYRKNDKLLRDFGW